MGSNESKLKVSELYQACIVVRDLERSMDQYRKILGIESWEVLTADPSSMTDMTYHGKPGKFSFKAAWTRDKVGGIQIELIQPVDGDNIYRDFLEEHGEGIHHIGFGVDDLDKEVAKLTEQGVSILSRTRRQGGCHRHTKSDCRK